MSDITNQFNYTGKGYLDSKMTVESYSDLSSIASGARFIGLTVTVLNATTTKVPMDFCLSGGTLNSNWKLKKIFPVANYEALSDIPSGATFVGLSVTVLSDTYGSSDSSAEDYNPNYGKIAEYYVSERDTKNKIITWTRRKNGNEVLAQIDDVVEMLMTKKYGNVVYTTDTIYSYIDPDSGELIWTAKVDEIPTGVTYETYTDGLYAIKESVSGGTASFEEIITSSMESEGVIISGSDAETN